jgi:hypothetical protein
MHLEAAERVVIARLEVGQRSVWHLRENRLPFRARGVEVGQSRVSVHGG